MAETDTTSSGALSVDGAPADPRLDPRPEPEHDASVAAASATATVDTDATIDATRLTRRGRVRKWDRPPPPHDWRWAVSHVGRVLIAVGLLMFGFVAYQLWGTAIENAQAQNALENDFEELLASVPPAAIDDPAADDTPDAADGSADESDADTTDASSADDTAVAPPVDGTVPADAVTDAGPTDVADATDPTSTDDGASDTADDVDAGNPAVIPVEEQNLPLFENGDALARIEIPSIGVNDIVVAGVEKSDLKRGPGHFPDTPLPGQLGNSAIAGHRTTYGQPFHDVDKLVPGDEIRVTTLTGVYVYRVTGQQIVSPSDYQVVATTDPTVANLTLTSCHPKWTAQQRIVIFSELDTEASNTVGEPVYNYGRDDYDETEVDNDDADAVLPGESTDDESESGDGADATFEDDDSTSGGDDTDTASDLDGAGAPTDGTTPPPAEAGIADAFSDGWFSDPGANVQVGIWGVIVALIGLAAYLLSRRFRRDWVGAMVGVVPFLVALYFFFQNVNRLLPPNL